jgi:predicted transcriptional regulator
MKTAVSIPDNIYERAERLVAQERRSRSEVYATALDEYLARHENDAVTDAMNRVCDEVEGNGGDAFLAAAGWQVLDRTEW